MMRVTDRAPNVPIAKFKRTKIIATIGPATDSYKAVLSMLEAGVNGFRLNFSHGTHEEQAERVKWVRKASKTYGKPVAIIQDLQGPKIRLGDFEGVVNVKHGQALTLKYGEEFDESKAVLPVQYDISKHVKRGERLLIYDGKIHTTITSVSEKTVHVKVENEGFLIKRKGINLPDTNFEGDIITAKDKQDIIFGSANDIDYVALSFVQQAEDIDKLRKLLQSTGSHAGIIAKIETKTAMDNVEEIIREADAVMVARGDLAMETSPEAVPIAQRQIIGLGLSYAKPTIIATQLLASMANEPEPTRAEVSDVATAVILDADCVMLSDETAIGRYPVEAVKTMKKVILYTQSHNPLQVSFPKAEAMQKQGAIPKAILNLADDVNAQAIVAETKSGATALNIAARRPDIPIIAVTSDTHVAQRLSIVYGMKSYVRPVDKYAATKLTNWLLRNKVLHSGDVVVTASGQYPGVVGTTDTIKVRML